MFENTETEIKPISFVPLFWIMAISFLGFSDAAYLTYKTYMGTPIPCSVTQGCHTVLTSAYSHVFGMPVSLFGVSFYLSVFILSLIITDTLRTKIFFLIFYLSLVAFLSSCVFVYLQLFVLKSICLYCMFSAGTSTLIFILALWFKKQTKSKNLSQI